MPIFETNYESRTKKTQKQNEEAYGNKGHKGDTQKNLIRDKEALLLKIQQEKQNTIKRLKDQHTKQRKELISKLRDEAGKRDNISSVIALFKTDQELLNTAELATLANNTADQLNEITKSEKEYDEQIKQVNDYLGNFKQANPEQVAEVQRSKPVFLMKEDEKFADTLKKNISKHFQDADVSVEMHKGDSAQTYCFDVKAKIGNEEHKIQVDGSGYSTANINETTATMMAITAKQQNLVSVSIKAATNETKLLLAKAVATQGIEIKHLEELTNGMDDVTKAKFYGYQAAAKANKDGTASIDVPHNLQPEQRKAFAEALQDSGVKIKNIDADAFKDGIDEIGALVEKNQQIAADKPGQALGK
jgi:hypothetical protein